MNSLLFKIFYVLNNKDYKRNGHLDKTLHMFTTLSNNFKLNNFFFQKKMAHAYFRRCNF